MAGSDRDLVLALRAELAAIDPSRQCDRDAERAGLEPGNRWRDATLARLAVRLARHDARAAASPAPFDWASRPDHCRMAWLRGRFLARGSLSLANGRTHLEILHELAAGSLALPQGPLGHVVHVARRRRTA